jgi:hypothetical protein
VTDPTSNQPASAASAPAGWYPVSAGSTQQRWWDGTAWTQHIYDPAAVAQVGPLKAPEGTNPSTVWFWLIAVGAPLLQLVSVLLEGVWFSSLAGGELADPAAIVAAEASPSYLGLILLSWGGYALFVVGAALDYRALRAKGVPRPFHWAWAFLSIIVYAIGRSLVARRRTGTGMTPLWVYIGLSVVVIVIGTVVIAGFVANAVSQISNSYPH